MNSDFSPIKSLKRNKYNEDLIDRQRIALEKYAKKKLSNSSSASHSDSDISATVDPQSQGPSQTTNSI